MDKAYADTVRLLLSVAPAVFASKLFAMKGSMAINLFVRNMPRLSVDINVVYLPRLTPRAKESGAVLPDIRIHPAFPRCQGDAKRRKGSTSLEIGS